MAIETTHTLERLSATGSKDSANKKKHEVVTNNKEKHSRARTPEEGICLEFEEFNPEVSEEEQRQEKRNKGSGKKEVNHKPKRDNKEINFFDEDVWDFDDDDDDNNFLKHERFFKSSWGYLRGPPKVDQTEKR